LKGIKKTEFSSVGKDIDLQQNSLKVLSTVVNKNIPAAIISVNWCKDIIKSVLRTGEKLDTIQVYSNDLEYDHQDTSTGLILGHMRTSFDKRSCFQRYMVAWSGTNNIF